MTPTNERPVLTRIAFALLWIFVFTIPATYATEIPMIGNISAICGVAAMVGCAIAVVSRRQVRILGGAHMAIGGYIVWSAITLCWSVAPDLTIHRLMTYTELFVLVLLVWEMCTEDTDVLRILGAFVLGTIVPALSTLYGFLPGQQILIQRASSAGYDANQLAFLLALSLPAAYFLILREKGPVVSMYRLQMGFAFCAIVLSGSPSAMTAMVVGLSIVFWTFQSVSARSRLNSLAIIMLMIGGSIVVIPSNVWNGINEQIRKGDVTLNTVINSEISRIPSTPLQGYGAGTQARPSANASNQLGGRPTAFTMLAETGPLGVACFLAIVGVLFMSALRMSGVDRSFWLTSLAVWVVGVFSLNWDCSQPAWLIFGLLAAHGACPRTQVAATVEAPKVATVYFDEQAQVWS